MGLFVKYCDVCGGRRRLFGSPKIVLSTTSGKVKCKVCEACEDTISMLEVMRNGVDPEPLKEK